jgi:hypothetical protein
MRLHHDVLRRIQRAVSPAIPFEHLSEVEKHQIERIACAAAGLVGSADGTIDLQLGANALNETVQTADA